MEVVACENYKRSALRRAGILACTISYSKKVAVSKSREIARVAYSGRITNIGSSCARKLYTELYREAWILECAIARVKKFFVSESREIA